MAGAVGMIRAHSPVFEHATPEQLSHQHDVGQVVHHVLPVQCAVVDLGRFRADLCSVQHQLQRRAAAVTLLQQWRG